VQDKRAVQLKLASFSIRKLVAAALGVSEGSAAEIRKKRAYLIQGIGEILANLANTAQTSLHLPLIIDFASVR
jgi:hypothetical protein